LCFEQYILKKEKIVEQLEEKFLEYFQIQKELIFIDEDFILLDQKFHPIYSESKKDLENFDFQKKNDDPLKIEIQKSLFCYVYNYESTLNFRNKENDLYNDIHRNIDNFKDMGKKISTFEYEYRKDRKDSIYYNEMEDGQNNIFSFEKKTRDMYEKDQYINEVGQKI